MSVCIKAEWGWCGFNGYNVVVLLYSVEHVCDPQLRNCTG